jgi:hypothetical protein
MPISFQSDTDPSQDTLEEVAALVPENPFCTPAYSRAMEVSGQQALVLALRDGCRLVSACTGFMKNGRMSRLLEIPSLLT